MDYATVKYNSSGQQQWVARYDGPGGYIDEARAIAVDGAGNVYVTGKSYGSNYSEYATIKYNSAGQQQWVARYTGPGFLSNGEATAMAIDGSGSVYVTGESYGGGSDNDYATIKYNSVGQQQWVARYNGPANGADKATAIAIDGAGNICVTGYSLGSVGYDYATIKYNSAGQQQWVRRYDGTSHYDDEATAIAVDGSGSVYVTGKSHGSGYSYDYATIQYNSAGQQQWAARYDGPGGSIDVATAIAVDNSGSVYVTGGSYGSGSNYDYATIKYNKVVTAKGASNITSSSATLNGTVNPNGLTTTVHFEYGTTTNYGFTTANSIHTGNTTQNVSANITGLSPNTTYHFRLVATNSGGTSYGNDMTFSTFSPTGPPVVATTAATNVASFSTTLNGSVYPHGLTTSVYFQYGTTTSYGFTTAPQTKTGNTYQSVSANIRGLIASTTYHFRIVTTNSAGTGYGSDRTFTTLSATGPPVVTTNPATNVATSLATLNGSLDPHGLTTSVYLQYGTTINYGRTTPMQSQTGNTYRNIAANIGGLATHTTYHFRIVATNSVGTRYGGDRTFTTQ